MKIVISGAGPAGLLMGHCLVRRPNHQVIIYDKGPNPLQESNKNETTRTTPSFASMERTYPIALQSRGLAALEEGIPGITALLESDLETTKGAAGAKWMPGVAMHAKGGKIRHIDRKRANLSVDRNRLVACLTQQLLQQTNQATGSSIEIFYGSKVEDIQVETKTLTIQQQQQQPTSNKSDAKTVNVSYDFLFVADGAKSQIRQVLYRKGHLKEEDCRRIADDYKALYLTRHPVATTTQTEDTTSEQPSLASDRIHVWQFGDGLTAIAVPLEENVCSGVFIFPEGKNPFATMTEPQQVFDFFKVLAGEQEKTATTTTSGSLSTYMTLEEANALLKRRVATNWTVRVNQMHVGSSVVLVGDAAHAVSASIGQGCNSALQDVQVFMRLWDASGNQKDESMLEQFSKERIPQVHALRELSDYSMPRTTWMRYEFIFRLLLGKILPEWLRKYFVGQFAMELLGNTDMPYTQVLQETNWWVQRVKQSVLADENNKKKAAAAKQASS